MMQEYDDDFFFEEDKIISTGNTNESTKCSNVLVSLENEITQKVESETPSQENANPIQEIQQTLAEEVQAECVFTEWRRDRFSLRHQELAGMRVTSGSVALRKDEKNLIGISIGGGAPLCPCLYIVQIFDNTPAAREGTLQSGDELVGVGGVSVKGKTKVEVAKMIQAAKEEVTINYNKLHAEPAQGRSLDIVMKKMKHRLAEALSANAADALGLSRAVLCNDALVAKLRALRDTEAMYRRLVDHAKRMLKAYFEVLGSYRALGDAFAGIGVREPQPRASAAFGRVGLCHRHLERDGIKMLKALKPILADMGTHLHKAIPDTKLTVRKYADAKFEYLSYCLKVKEMDDEEAAAAALQEPLYRVETGNYEYRLILRCRQASRVRFAKLRSDVLVKLELLDSKRAHGMATQLSRFVEGLALYHSETVEHLKENASLFPVEVDLAQNAFQYKSATKIIQDNQEEDEEIEYGSEIQEHYDTSLAKPGDGTDATAPLLDGLDGLGGLGSLGKVDGATTDHLSLLAELGLDDSAVADDFGDFQNAGDRESSPTQRTDHTDDVFDKLLSELRLRTN